MRSYVTLSILAPLAVVGCSSGPALGPSSGAVTVASDLPPPGDSDVSFGLSKYRIGPMDEIKVEVFGAPELNREGQVDAAGNFAVPLAGTLPAGGKTPAEFAELVSEQLRGRYLKNPQVSVNVLKALGSTFTVDGAVRQPGVYPVVGNLTLQRAVATARGADETANLGNVVVFRTVDNQKMAALFNLKDIRAGRVEDPAIFGNDIVVVGESALKRFLGTFGGVLPVVGRFVPIP